MSLEAERTSDFVEGNIKNRNILQNRLTTLTTTSRRWGGVSEKLMICVGTYTALYEELMLICAAGMTKEGKRAHQLRMRVGMYA